jgi:hypothetical protein
MAADTTISASGGAPQVTVTAGNLIRYRCQFFLVKPVGQTWPETGSRLKLVHEVVFNKDHAPTDTFSLGNPGALESLELSWAIDMKVPGGGGPVQFFAQVEIEQDGKGVMDPWSDQGVVNNTEATGDVSIIKVTP